MEKVSVTKADLSQAIGMGIGTCLLVLTTTGALINTHGIRHVKPWKLAAAIALIGLGAVGAKQGKELDEKLYKRRSSDVAKIASFDMDNEQHLHQLEAQAQMAQVVQAAKSIQPYVEQLKQLRESGVPFAYLASMATGEGIQGIIRYEAMREAHDEQIRIEQTMLPQQQVVVQQEQHQEIHQVVLPENATRILRVAELPKIQLSLDWEKSLEAPNIIREIFSLPSGIDKLKAFESELALEFGQNIICGVAGAGQIFVEIPRSDRVFPQVPDQQWEQGGAKIILGENTKGQVALDLTSDISPHLLIGGMTRQGKTMSVLYPIVYSLLKQGCEVIVVGGKVKDYEYLIDNHGLKFEDNEFAHVYAADFARECDVQRKFSTEQLKSVQRRVLVIDEYSSTVRATYKEAQRLVERMSNDNGEPLKPAERKRFIAQMVEEYDQNLSEIGRIGGGIKRHLVIATQRTALRSDRDPDGIPTTVRANLAARIAVRCRDSTEGDMILGCDGNIAAGLLGKGDAYLVANDVSERYQGYCIPQAF
ncbi:MAG: hypothetical protein PUP93_26825 [Rhizonema sp. NSF051]|nr:hypothetical protein [Rhizonema sp. NSF051]